MFTIGAISIKQKLRLMVVFTCMVALMLAGTVFGFFGVKWIKKQTKQELVTLADFFAYASEAPLEFANELGGKAMAQRFIDGYLRANNDVILGCLYDANDRLVVQYNRPHNKHIAPPKPPSLRFNPKTLEC